MLVCSGCCLVCLAGERRQRGKHESVLLCSALLCSALLESLVSHFCYGYASERTAVGVSQVFVEVSLARSLALSLSSRQKMPFSSITFSYFRCSRVCKRPTLLRRLQSPNSKLQSHCSSFVCCMKSTTCMVFAHVFLLSFISTFFVFASSAMPNLLTLDLHNSGPTVYLSYIMTSCS